jgi:hypothetical protein
VDQWEDAAKEYGTAAGLYQELLGDDRKTVEALFLAGLALQMIEQRAGCVKAISDARDTMARLVEKDPENEELKAILNDLKAKATEVLDDKTWMNDEADIEKALEAEEAQEEVTKRVLGEDENDLNEEEPKKRKIEDE